MTRVLYVIMFLLILCLYAPVFANDFDPDKTQTITIEATVYSEADFMSLEECTRTTDPNKRAECAELIVETAEGEENGRNQE